jgi:hypothetical protein
MADGPSAAPSDHEGLTAVIAPYIQAAGEVVHAWNRLQEALKEVFATVTKMPRPMAYSIWHSLRSDLSQRDMLRAAISALPDDDLLFSRFPDAKGDILMPAVYSSQIGRNSE